MLLVLVFTAPAADSTGCAGAHPDRGGVPSPCRMLMRRCCTPPVRPARLGGVVYTQRQLAGMRDAIANTYGFAPGSGLGLASRRLHCWARRWVLPA